MTVEGYNMLIFIMIMQYDQIKVGSGSGRTDKKITD